MNDLFEIAQSIVTERFVLALADLSDSFSQSVLSRNSSMINALVRLSKV